MMSGRPKRKQDYPCIRCDIHVKVNEHAVKCALCDLWVHKKCENMSDDVFKVLDMQNDETGQCFWSCKSCRSYAMKFDKRMRAMETRIQNLETKLPNVETDLAAVKNDITDLKKKQKEKPAEGSTNPEKVTASVLEEMKERQARRCNLVIHNLDEPSDSIREKKERIEADKHKVQELCNEIGLEFSVFEEARFVKRLGEKDDSSIRPMLIGFKSERTCNDILDKSKELAHKEQPWSDVHIIRDLTKCQRKEEKQLRDDCTKKNDERSEEDALNWEWKVVGRRGERKLIKATVEKEELQGGKREKRSTRSRKNAGGK